MKIGSLKEEFLSSARETYLFDCLVAGEDAQIMSAYRDVLGDFIRFTGNILVKELTPDHVLLPMNGWDAQGYRLGYGGGFFDRTLASLKEKPLVIGVSYEMARLATIHPQPWDIPMDYVVTERGVYRRDGDELVFLGAPGPTSEMASPVCYADERIVRGE